MNHAPDLDSLLGAALHRDRDRLRRVHDLLLEAGPLPQLPPSLREPPQVAVRTLRPAPLRTRRRGRLLLAPVAAALAIAAAGGAYLLAGQRAEPVRTTVAMHATAAAPTARALLTVGSRDAAGNWPITLRIRGLPALPRGAFYEMYLTDKGHVVGSCGVFRTNGGPTVVHLNAPYTLGEYSGWIIKRRQPHQPDSPPLLIADA